mmetsp:Transcript_19277/g.33373  ORF Transcript_19277/g.33373 Transcript_19277/m.33373 type:complete len:188 (-) Transcript_19277:545-1108(-)|eukprot:CAMPEP_0171493366 /NCGR_PEP_ID=MMETSP0958-20121227/4922_1 /TAXON_ID=87120 /ORGANISM="Aurantiochytrium limacinum, Strain ATCCMYA-1381" /LENGTH=187 /DNA_ID=CAMNT_0012026981 /DNA_START=14 /DNA_END=577 /DNA_ORIENTATION=-
MHLPIIGKRHGSIVATREVQNKRKQSVASTSSASSSSTCSSTTSPTNASTLTPASPTRGRGGPYVATLSRDAQHRMYSALESEICLIRGEYNQSGAGIFKLKESTGNEGGEQGESSQCEYEVTIARKPSCTCPAHQIELGPCKHIFFVMLRVCHCKAEDPVVWQEYLKQEEVDTLLGRTFKGLHNHQ